MSDVKVLQKRRKRKSNSPTVLDLFCGCGGFSLGFEAAGFDIVMGVDIWETACKSYAVNFPSATVVCADVLDLDASLLPQVDVVIGSPPCQDFSVANLDRSEDPVLIDAFWDIVDAIQPEWVLMEEVPFAKKYIPKGWKKKVYWSCDYGVPQIRKRLFAGRFVEPEKHPVEPIFPTVVASEYKGVSSRDRGRLSDLFGRKATIHEMLLVQTFPLDYFVAGETLEDIYRQIGNAVPPVLAYHFAKAIMQVIEYSGQVNGHAGRH